MPLAEEGVNEAQVAGERLDEEIEQSMTSQR
jgi:hypothetical protein